MRQQVSGTAIYLGVSAVGHLLWEIVHLPLYTIGQTGSPGARAFAVIHCTAGDLVITGWTLLAALLVARPESWPTTGTRRVAGIALPLGLLYTGYSEWHNVYVKQAWAYAPSMPTMRVGEFAIGLSPLLQWVVIPAIGFFLTHVLCRRLFDRSPQ